MSRPYTARLAALLSLFLMAQTCQAFGVRFASFDHCDPSTPDGWLACRTSR